MKGDYYQRFLKLYDTNLVPDSMDITKLNCKKITSAKG